MTFMTEAENIGRARERRHYIVGALLTVTLTLMAFGFVAMVEASQALHVTVISALALVQIVVHFRFFLHIDREKSHRDDLMLILFAGLIILLMVAGTAWIIFDQYLRMM